ncbi:MAG TPA: hypothetical protein PKE58_14220, partial [Acidobacteriota bacterium]|nr:hypothetical protein [Acidobacteriota bacterium]
SLGQQLGGLRSPSSPRTHLLDTGKVIRLCLRFHIHILFTPRDTLSFWDAEFRAWNCKLQAQEAEKGLALVNPACVNLSPATSK